MAALPPKIPSAKYVKAPLTKEKCSSVTFVKLPGIWTAFSPPSPTTQLEFGCDHSVLEFKSFSLLINWYTEWKTENEMHPRMIKRRIFYEKNAPQARFLM